MHFDDYTSGAKSCIELIAVYAANQEEKMPTKSYLRSFQRFIQELIHFDDLNIHFEKNVHDIWDKNPPRVIDAINPYNNLAKNWRPKSIELVKNYASETQRRLSNHADQNKPRLDELFAPQSLCGSDIREIFPHNCLIGATTTANMCPDLNIRNERFRKDQKLRKDVDILNVHLQSAMCAAMASNLDENQMLTVVQKTVSKHVHKGRFTWVSAGNVKHEDHDITFTIPTTNGKAIRVSYKL